MIELFEQDIKTLDRQSSKGNQLKWKKGDNWYKADYTGYEGLSEYVISNLLKYSNLDEKERVIYHLTEIKYKSVKYNGAFSRDFAKNGWQVITLERLFNTFYGKSLHSAIHGINDEKERLLFIVNSIETITGLKNFGKYMNKLLTIDMMFLNEDRHTHNIAVLWDGDKKFDYCPIFDNGAGLLADTTMEYPMNEDIYKLIDSVKSKTFLDNFEEQTDVSEILYGKNLTFYFTKKNVDELLDSDEAAIYPIEIRERVRRVLFEQMRRYPYLFN